MGIEDIDDSIPQDLAVLGEKSGVQQEVDEETYQEPFNPRDISITSKLVTLDAVIRRLKQETLHLAPDFQRNVIWDNTRKSLLIESLMLNIPIAIFYVADNGDGKWEVVDGLQRLTAIKEFVYDKKLHLEGLEFWKQYNGYSFEDLPPFPSNQIMETEFNFVIIEPSTPESVKYNIFKRINTGGLPLSNQEIRHALYHGKGTQMLLDLSKSSGFLEATDNSINDSRMAAREIILRCLSFLILGYENYQPDDNMDLFLGKGLRVLNSLEETSDKRLEKDYDKDISAAAKIKKYSELKAVFDTGMRRNMELFGKNAFRISPQDGARTPVNKSLFETWGGILGMMLEDEYDRLIQNKESLLALHDKKKKSPPFIRSVSRDAWKKANVSHRFRTVEEIIKGALHDKRSQLG